MKSEVEKILPLCGKLVTAFIRRLINAEVALGKEETSGFPSGTEWRRFSPKRFAVSGFVELRIFPSPDCHCPLLDMA